MIVPGKFTSSLILTCSVLFSSCGPVKDGATARIHQSWDARFSYDFEKRRLVSVNNKKMRGRTWGSDEFGRVNYDRYWTGRPILSQNLMDSYRARVDAILENRWQTSESERLVRRKEEMENEAKIGEKLDGKKKGDGTFEVPPEDKPMTKKEMQTMMAEGGGGNYQTIRVLTPIEIKGAEVVKTDPITGKEIGPDGRLT